MKFLEKMDDYFSTKKKSEKWMIIIATVVVIVYFLSTFIYPYAHASYAESKKNKQEIQKSIAKNRHYLESVTKDENHDFYMQKLDKRIAEKKRTLLQLNHKIATINTKLKKISESLFSKTLWSDFLNSLTTKAKIQNLDIQYISNTYIDHNESFGRVLEINVGCKGAYSDMIAFMQGLEQSKLITEIDKTTFLVDKETSDIIADIHVSVWGINH